MSLRDPTRTGGEPLTLDRHPMGPNDVLAHEAAVLGPGEEVFR